jgi:RNA polymerase sigma factor (TIGR02999 family)
MGNSTDSLLQTLFSELRLIARQKLSTERPDHTLQATALVNEVFIKFKDRSIDSGWQSRSHFVRTAAEAMRQVLVDHARARLTRKRGAGQVKQRFADVPVDLPLPSEEIIAIHECLDKFAEEDPVKADLVKLRVFSGMTNKDAAAELGISRQTADRYWSYAKLRLFTLINGTPESA